LRIVRASAATVMGWFIPLVAVFVCAPILLQTMGKQVFGAWMIGVLIPTTVAQLDFGLSTFAVRWLVRHDGRSRTIESPPDSHAVSVPAAGKFSVARLTEFMPIHLKSAEGPCLFVIGLVVGTIGSLLTLLILMAAGQTLGLSPLRDGSSTFKFAIILSLWGGLSLATAIWSAYWRAFDRLVLLGLIQALSGGGLWVVSSIAATHGVSLADLAALAATWFLVCALPILKSVLFVSWEGVRLTLTQFLIAYWRERKFVGGLVGAQAASLVTYQSDRYILSAISGPVVVGVYSVLSGLASKLIQFLAVGTSVLFPYITRQMIAGNVNRLNDLFVQASQLLIILLVAFTFTGFWVAEEFLRLWLRTAFSAEYVTILKGLILASGMASTSVVASNFYVASGKSTLSLRYSWLGAGITAVACLLLIPKYGALGAVVAVNLGCLQALVFAGHIRRLLGFDRAISFRLLYALLVGCVVALVPQLFWRELPASWLKVVGLGGASFLSIVGIAGLLVPGLRQLMLRRA
jgi:O-antigen/teichoic acid export membrane protein